jgi:hypothetical protein
MIIMPLIILQMTSIHMVVISAITLLILGGGVIWRTAISISRKASVEKVEVAMKEKIDRREFEEHKKQNEADFHAFDLMFEDVNKELSINRKNYNDIMVLLARMDVNIEYIIKNCSKNKC